MLLDKPNLGFVIATPIGLVLAGGFAALSALDRELVRPRLLELGLLVGLAAWLVAVAGALPRPRATWTIPDRLSFPLVALAMVGSALYAFAVVRYAQLWRKRRSGLLLAFTVAFVLLAEAMIAVAVGRSWQASWWEWHVLMLVAFGLIAWAAHREWHEERFSPLYGDETAAGTQELSVLFADLQGFTAFSETHEADEVGRMLNTLFESAIPEIERQAGEIDRLIGDAVFARFTGDDHAERAARAALGLQKATATVAAGASRLAALPRRRQHGRGERRRARQRQRPHLQHDRRHGQPRLPDRGPGAGGRGRDQRRDGGQLLGAQTEPLGRSA